MRPMIILFALAISTGAFAQKKPLIESREKVEQMAKQEFKLSMTGPEGGLYLFGIENSIKGEYKFKLTLGDRGRVTSIFVVSRVGGDIPSQNTLKDAVKAFKFKFKLPKNKDYSFEHTFKFK